MPLESGNWQGRDGAETPGDDVTMDGGDQEGGGGEEQAGGGGEGRQVQDQHPRGPASGSYETFKNNKTKYFGARHKTR